MSTIRDKAKDYLDKNIPAIGQQITSNGATAATFTRLTGATQAGLEANWAKGGYWTTCNEFVGHYSTSIGTKDYLGRFDIDQFLAAKGKGLAWIPRSDDVRPNYGDVFLVRHDKVLHMGVSLDFDGDKWNTIESGQGGPLMKCDVIKRKLGDYASRDHLGWVDLDIYNEAPAQAGAAPSWVVGWWQVTWRAQTYYYFFDAKRQVKWTQNQPTDLAKGPILPRDTGEFAAGSPATVVIRWDGSNSVEKFSMLPTATAQTKMSGTWNWSESIEAVRM